MQHPADEGRGAGDDPAPDRVSAPGQLAGVGQRLGEAHADPRADRRGHADQEGGVRPLRGVGAGEDRRQRRHRAVHQPDERRLDHLEEEAFIVLRGAHIDDPVDLLAALGQSRIRPRSHRAPSRGLSRVRRGLGYCKWS